MSAYVKLEAVRHTSGGLSTSHMNLEVDGTTYSIPDSFIPVSGSVVVMPEKHVEGAQIVFRMDAWLVVNLDAHLRIPMRFADSAAAAKAANDYIHAGGRWSEDALYAWVDEQQDGGR